MSKAKLVDTTLNLRSDVWEIARLLEEHDMPRGVIESRTSVISDPYFLHRRRGFCLAVKRNNPRAKNWLHVAWENSSSFDEIIVYSWGQPVDDKPLTELPSKACGTEKSFLTNPSYGVGIKGIVDYILSQVTKFCNS